LDIAFRIYDNCLASGIEAIFGFSIVLLQKNEDALLTLKFDEILAFMKTRVFEKYKVSVNLSLLLDKLIVPLLTDRTV
jgi:ecotropic viral integration site 5 protein